jgi:Rhodopirellula transposase DDE domain
MEPYTSQVEQQMQRFYASLSEKDRRRYAAVEVLKLGWGGLSYITQLLHCDDDAIQLGKRELAAQEPLNDGRIRRFGGGRKSALATMEGLNEAFLGVLAQHTAGSPMDETVKWTHLTRHQIAQLLKEQGMGVSVTVVDQLFEQHHYRQRKAQKRLATGRHSPRLV